MLWQSGTLVPLRRRRSFEVKLRFLRGLKFCLPCIQSASWPVMIASPGPAASASFHINTGSTNKGLGGRLWPIREPRTNFVLQGAGYLSARFADPPGGSTTIASDSPKVRMVLGMPIKSRGQGLLTPLLTQACSFSQWVVAAPKLSLTKSVDHASRNARSGGILRVSASLSIFRYCRRVGLTPNFWRSLKRTSCLFSANRSSKGRI